MSLYRWIDYQEPLNESSVSENKMISEHSYDELSESGSKVNIELG